MKQTRHIIFVPFALILILYTNIVLAEQYNICVRNKNHALNVKINGYKTNSIAISMLARNFPEPKSSNSDLIGPSYTIQISYKLGDKDITKEYKNNLYNRNRDACYYLERDIKRCSDVKC